MSTSAITESNQKSTNKKKQGKKTKETLSKNPAKKQVVNYLIPLPLILIVFICSGFCWTLSFRDVMATGRPIFGPMDEALMVSTINYFTYDRNVYIRLWHYRNLQNQHNSTTTQKAGNQKQED